jgi:hypothetical protein
MHSPFHPPLLDHSTYIWRRVQAMKLLIWVISLEEQNICKNVHH